MCHRSELPVFNHHNTSIQNGKYQYQHILTSAHVNIQTYPYQHIHNGTSPYQHISASVRTNINRYQQLHISIPTHFHIQWIPVNPPRIIVQFRLIRPFLFFFISNTKTCTLIGLIRHFFVGPNGTIHVYKDPGLTERRKRMLADLTRIPCTRVFLWSQHAVNGGQVFLRGQVAQVVPPLEQKLGGYQFEPRRHQHPLTLRCV